MCFKQLKCQWKDCKFVINLIYYCRPYTIIMLQIAIAALTCRPCLYIILCPNFSFESSCLLININYDFAGEPLGPLITVTTIFWQYISKSWFRFSLPILHNLNLSMLLPPKYKPLVNNYDNFTRMYQTNSVTIIESIILTPLWIINHTLGTFRIQITGLWCSLN